jgi:hypothetical protein
MSMNRYLFLILSIAILGESCTEIPKEITSFYYWKTSYNPTNFENTYLETEYVQKMYIRCFDLMYESANSYKPSNVILWKQKPHKNIAYIPVVFIDKIIFENIDSVNNVDLANKINRLCKQIFASQHIHFTEIQIDCDWTKLSQKNYFLFLKNIKKIVPKISATLRLHQYKYQTKTGIPPVDYCTIMCYNIGDLKSKQATNSILNQSDFDSYGKGKNYPLPTNIALPIYTWTLLFRNNQFYKILAQDVNCNHANWEQKSKTQYVCKTSFYDSTNSNYFYENDVVKIEKWTKSEWKSITHHIKQNLQNTKNEIIYFDLDSTNIQTYLLR